MSEIVSESSLMTEQDAAATGLTVTSLTEAPPLSPENGETLNTSMLDSMLEEFNTTVQVTAEKKGLSKESVQKLGMKYKKSLVGAALFLGLLGNGLAQTHDIETALIYTGTTVATIADDKVDPLDIAKELHEEIHNGGDISGTLGELGHGFGKTIGLSSLLGAFLWKGATKKVESGLNYDTNHRDKIKKGELPVVPQGEKPFILGGNECDFANAFKSQGVHPRDYVPIFNSPEGADRLLQQFPEVLNEKNGYYINLGSDVTHSEANPWGLLKISEENLIKTENGELVLNLYASGSKIGCELSHDPQDVDVTIPDMLIALDHIKDQLPEDVQQKVKDMPVYVGNGHVKLDDVQRPGQKISVREIAQKKEMVLIDTEALTQRAIYENLSKRGLCSVRFIIGEGKDDARAHIEAHLPENVTVCRDDEETGDEINIILGKDSFHSVEIVKLMDPAIPKLVITTESDAEEVMIRNGIIEDRSTIGDQMTEAKNTTQLIDTSRLMAKAVLLTQRMTKKGHSWEEIQARLDTLAPPLRNGNGNGAHPTESEHSAIIGSFHEATEQVHSQNGREAAMSAVSEDTENVDINEIEPGVSQE